jgi:hypothetical protein
MIARQYRRSAACLVCLLQVARPTAAYADEIVQLFEELCPQAVREHEQLLLTHPIPKDVKIVTRPALRKDLLQMVEEDQIARRNLVVAMKDGQALPEDDYVRQVDTRNLRRLKHIVDQDGFPTITMVGIEGVEAAFVLIAHAEADVPFQERMLKVLSDRARAGEIKGGELALLTDKILRARGKPQRYGTQFGDDMKPEPIADEAHVDERRHALGMISMANYSFEMRAFYGAAH